MLMCDKCKEKIHVKFKFAKDHKVVSIQNVGLHDEEIDFTNMSCKNHVNQVCFMFCKSCDCLVCPLCISKTHNGHDLVTIREGYEIQVDKLKNRQHNIRINLNELNKRKTKVEDFDRSEHSKLENIIEKIKAQKIMLKSEVDKHTENIISEILERWEALHQSTTNEKEEVTILIAYLETKQSEAGDIIQSNHAKRIFEDGCGIVKSDEETVTSPNTKFDAIPTFIPGQISAFNIGSLENVSIKGEIKISKQFDTNIQKVYYMTASSEDTFWITDCIILQKVKLEGKGLKVVDQKDMKIFGMALTPAKDLLLVSEGSILTQINGETGEVTKSRYKVKNFVLSAVHVNQDGIVTVGAYTGELVYPVVGRGVVVVMDKCREHETTYEFDGLGNPLFSNVKKVNRTKNGNICIVDKLSEDGRGRVIVLNVNGDVLNIFSGHPEVNSDKIPFKPVYAFTLKSDNILVTNLSYSILYFLNNSGFFLKWCKTSAIGVQHPYSFCTTDSGRAYMGSVRPKNSSDNGKIYEVIIL